VTIRNLIAGALMIGVLAASSAVLAQVDSPTTTTAADDRDDGMEWGWLGLLGLFGLLGLRRRDRIDVTAHSAARPHRTTP
jgi:MYXO-CTERM domain-containing protein